MIKLLFKKNLKFTLIFLISNLFLISSSQNSILKDKNGIWRNGLIITNNNDTVQGQIFDIEYRNYKECIFRNAKDSITKVYLPKQIHSFQIFNGKYYISKQVETNSYQFLEYLINGEASIYCSRLSANFKRFYIEKDNNIYELKNSDKEQIIDGQIYKLGEKKEYLGYLRYLLKDAQISDDIDNTSLTEKSLINLSINYHNEICNDYSCIIYEKKYYDIFSHIFRIAWNKGFIIDKENVRREGYIQYKSEFEGLKCRYKKQTFYDKYKEYTSEELVAFQINNKYYISKEIENKEKYFLEKLITGQISLYRRYIGVVAEYYIEKNNTLYTLRHPAEKVFIERGKKIAVERKEYIGVLIYLFQDAKMQDQIEKMNFDSESMIDVVRTYNSRIIYK